jgi:hemolysin activation/secretion protein
VLAAAVALTADRVAVAQQQQQPQPASAPAAAAQQRQQQQADPIVRVDRFDAVFQVSSMSGAPAETRSLHLIGKAPDGLVHEPADKDSYTLTSDDIDNTPLTLGIVDGRFTSPDRAKQTVHLRLKDLAYPSPAPYHISAIASILKQVADHMNQLGLIAVLPHTDPAQLQEVRQPDGRVEFKDDRQGGDKSLRIVVQLGVVTNVRTIASGDRVSSKDRVNAPQHERIRFGSPVWPAESSTQGERKDVVRKDLLDEYVFALNRYPGRRVDVAVSQGDVPGGIALDYLVSETKPWTIYAQASNTGTAQTNEWRERFGFVDNQLTGNDDTISLDYITAGFDGTSNALIGSYEFPIPTFRRLRARVYGSYSDFVASDVGQTLNRFNGQETTGGAELIANVWQHRDWFGDVIAGGRYEHVHTVNQTAATEGTADLGVPYVGGRVERVTDTTSFSTSATGSFGFTDASQQDLNALGRLDADKDFFTLELAANYSFYIEPLLFPERFLGGQDGKNRPAAKLANEIALSARGQTSFGARLIPQHEEVAGGLYSVRGYPESVVAGDDVLVGSAEYRFHLPRAFDMQPTPPRVFGSPFRVAPDRPLGRPDWDLILKTFVDAAAVHSNDRFSFERDETLVGTGLGLELQVKQNFNFQVYWGIALTDVPGLWEAGDNRFNFVFTVLY